VSGKTPFPERHVEVDDDERFTTTLSLTARQSAAASVSAPLPFPAEPPRSVPPPSPYPSPYPPPPPSRSGTRRTGLAAHPEAVRLVWFEPSHAHRLRYEAGWRALLDERAARAEDRELDDYAEALGVQCVDDCRAFFEVMTRATPTPGERVAAGLRESVRDDGKLIPPVVLLHGTLTPLLDPVERLKQTALLAPLLSNDPRVTAAAAAAAPLAASAPPSLAERLAAQIRDAYRRAHRDVGDAPLADAVDEVLLGQRAYARVRLFGAARLRTELAVGPGTRSYVAYLPETVGDSLPLAASFRARVIAEVHPREDQREKARVALRAIALGVVDMTEELSG
jgi:hypothetical protein